MYDSGLSPKGRVKIYSLLPSGERVQVAERKNVWTRYGREFLAKIKSRTPGALTWDWPVTPDYVWSVALGTGSQPSVPTVSRLVAPETISTGPNVYLCDLAVPPVYTLGSSGVEVMYRFTFADTDYDSAGVTLTEAGLYLYSADDAGVAASTVSPVAYVSGFTFPKFPDYGFEVEWVNEH